VVPHGISWRALGGRRISVVDGRPALQERAETLGFTALDPRRTRDWPIAPLTVDAAGTPAGLRTVLKHTAPDGICSCVWSPHRRGVIPLAAEYIRNVTLHIGRAHIRTLIPEVLALIASGQFQPEVVTSNAASFDDAPAALRDHCRCNALKPTRPVPPTGSARNSPTAPLRRSTYVVGDQTKAIVSFFTL
jgi:alcohol dehydrogenase